MFKNLKFFIENPSIFFFHWNELKLRFFYGFFSIIWTSIITYIYSDQIIFLITNNLLYNMNSHRFIFTKLTEIFFMYIKFSLITGIIFSIPIFIIQLWLFFLPGLYKYEKKIFDLYFIISFIFFFISFFINYYYLIPNILKFFLNFEQTNSFFPLHFEAKLEDFLYFIIYIFINIIICFQLPPIIVLLILLNILSYDFFILNRKYFFIFFLFLSAIIAPPELYIQLFITLIMIGFYEIILFCIFIIKYLK